MKTIIFTIGILILLLPMANAQNGADDFYLLNDNRLELYPNPTAQGNIMYVHCCYKPDDPVDISIYDMVGRLVYRIQKERAGASQLAISTKNMATGQYFFKLKTGSNVRTTKIMITE